MRSDSRLAKLGWVLTLACGLAVYGWYRLQPGRPYSVRRIAPSYFDQANRGGVLVGREADTIVVFSSYVCPYAAELFAGIRGMLAKDETSLTVRFRHVADPVADSSAFLVSVAARCAASQGCFLDFSSWLFRNYDRTVLSLPSGILRGLPLVDANLFTDCLASPDVRSSVSADMHAAMALGIRGTPTILTRRYMAAGSMTEEQLWVLLSR